MILIKSTAKGEGTEPNLPDPLVKREVYKLKDRYRKIWYSSDPEKWLKTDCIESHVAILNKIKPGFILDYGINNEKMFIDYKIIPGKAAYDFKLTTKFLNKIKKYCLDSLKQTWPYAHYDWGLGNILIDGDNIDLIDWDNVKKWDEQYTLDEMITLLDKKIDMSVFLFSYKLNKKIHNIKDFSLNKSKQTQIKHIIGQLSILLAWKDFYNYNTIIIEGKHKQWFDNILATYYHFVNPPHEVELYTYEELGMTFEDHFQEKYKWKDFYDASGKKSVKVSRKPNKFENYEKDIYVYSFMNMDTTIAKKTHDPWQILFRGLPNDHFKAFSDLFKKDERFINLGVTIPKEGMTTEQMIYKFEAIQKCRFFFGSACTWSRFAAWYNKDRYNFINRQIFGKSTRSDDSTFRLMKVISTW